jgi:hypothetical protein
MITQSAAMLTPNSLSLSSYTYTYIHISKYKNIYLYTFVYIYIYKAINEEYFFHVCNTFILSFQVMHMITQSAPMLAPFFASHDDSTVHAICTAIVSLIMRETALVSSINGCNPSFFQLLLQCTLMKPRYTTFLYFLSCYLLLV